MPMRDAALDFDRAVDDAIAAVDAGDVEFEIPQQGIADFADGGERGV